MSKARSILNSVYLRNGKNATEVINFALSRLAELVGRIETTHYVRRSPCNDMIPIAGKDGWIKKEDVLNLFKGEVC